MSKDTADSGGRNIAMWSAPRNLSTAMMRSFENRPDTTVIDEPFYAHYLANNTVPHPLREETIAAGETSAEAILARLVKPPRSGLCYQKHITTHWSDSFGTEWLSLLSHAFLIRPPASVVASYDVKYKGGTMADLGYVEQHRLFDTITEMTGEPPAVIDASRFLENPEAQLRKLCERLSIPFYAGMLNWPAGARDSDGVWGQHWYDSVNASTGFKAPGRKPVSLEDLSAERRAIADQCQVHYEALRKYAI